MTYLDEFGPFFGVDTHDGDLQPGSESHSGTSGVPPPGWLRWRDLVDGSPVMARRVDRVRAALSRSDGDVELRVAASVTHLGLVARVIAPMIAIDALNDPPMSMAPDDIWWRDDLGGPFGLSMTRRPLGSSPTVDTHTDAVTAVTKGIAEMFAVSPRTLWGNVASAANSAARMISLARPDLTERARIAADRLLADPRVEDGELRSGPGFRRRSCCLIYRVTGDRTAVCGDCVLDAAP